MVAFQIETFDEAITYLGDEIGGEFLKAINLVDDILENSSSYTGPQARMAALKMAAYRTKVGLASQQAKLRRSELKRPHDRLRADALICMYEALGEVINTLKLIGRAEQDFFNG